MPPSPRFFRRVNAMALRYSSSTSRRDLGPRDSPPVDSSAPISQGGSSNECKDDVGRKTKEEADCLLAKLEKEGVEINEKIPSIIDDGIARIKAEAVREGINEPKRDGVTLLNIIGSIAIGFMIGAEWCERAFRAANDKRGRALDKNLAKSRRA